MTVRSVFVAKSRAQKSNLPTVNVDAASEGRRQRRSQIIAALIGAFALVISSVITGFVTWANTRNSTSGPQVAGSGNPRLGPIDLPGDNGIIGQVVNLSGTVYNLKPGQVVWTFNQPISGQAASSGFFADTGPCAVTGNTWSCSNVYIGISPTAKDSKAGQGTYLIWAVILSDQDAFNIVNDLRCNSTPSHSCPTISALPGTDIAQPRKITVYRTH
jgi:hypothetical protein